MRLFAAVLLLSGVAFANSYSSTFSGTENPISESGNWINGLATGLDWGNVQKTPGLAFGTNVSPAPPYNDSVAVLSGTWGANQTACAVVALGSFTAGHSRNTGDFEVEVHLRRSITAHTSTGYEFLYSIKNNGSQYAQMVYWSGAINAFTVIVGATGTPTALATGDTLCASVTGNNFTFTRNGATVLSHTDTSKTTGGSPGIGFFNQNGVVGDNAGFGFSSFTASDGVTGGTFYTNNAASPGCSDTAGQAGDILHPFCTMTYGISRMSASNTLIVKAGTYAGDFTITGPSGTSGAHTVIMAATGESVIINGPSINSGRMKISHGCSWIDFKGFIITNHNQGLYLDDDAGTSTACTNILVDGITVHDVGQEGIAVRAGATGTAARNFTIQNSIIYNTGLLAPNQNGEGIYLGNSSGTDTTNGVTLKNNTIHDASSECIELKGDSHDNIIDGNNLSNCITSNSSFGNTGGAIEVDEPRNTATNPNQIIRNNIIHDMPNASGITKRGIRCGTGCTAYNNVLYNIGTSYSCMLANTANFPRKFYNNTIDCTTANAVVNSGTTLDSQNNLGPPSSGNNLAISSAYFANYAGHDYHLVTGAAPNAAGADLTTTVPTDITGTTRTPPISIGAYQFANGTAIASCSQANVQSAINSASQGATIIMPAGNCTWSTSVTIAGKSLTLVGSGIGSTNITDGTTTGALVVTGLDATHFVDVSGFTLIKSANDPNGMIQLHSTGVVQFVQGFRIHGIRFVEATGTSRGIEPIGIYGLIDHNTFDVTATTGSIQMISPFGSDDGADGGYTPWTQPLTMGTKNAVYIEDNTFNYGSNDEDCIDAYGGARVVIRYNTFNNAHIGWHGTDSGGRRSPLSVEVYNNTFINNNTSAGVMRRSTVRGGTAIFFNNSYSGTPGYSAQTLMLYRACPTLDNSWGGSCDGTNYTIGSTNFASGSSRVTSTGGPVKFCSLKRDNVCTADADCTAISGGTCSTYFDGTGSGGYACRDQPGRGPGQLLDPIYEWNDTPSNNTGTYNGGFSCGLGLANYLQSGRDYINGSAMPGYTPYTYPFSLNGSGGTTGPMQVQGVTLQGVQFN